MDKINRFVKHQGYINFREFVLSYLYASTLVLLILTQLFFEDKIINFFGQHDIALLLKFIAFSELMAIPYLIKMKTWGWVQISSKLMSCIVPFEWGLFLLFVYAVV